MKLVIDEKLKHRLVGVSVILSLGAIFLPAMMKKSSQRLESNFSVNVQLPPKPVAPNVAITDEEQMFKTIKIAKAQTLSVPQEPMNVDVDKKMAVAASAPLRDDELIPISKIEPAPESIEKPLAQALNDAVNNEVKRQITVAVANKRVQPVKVAASRAKAKVMPKSVVAKVAKKPVIKRDIYALQLASFSKLSNAQVLVGKLQQKGYKANYTRSMGKNGLIYKVYVGHSPLKNNVVKLKTQLASAMQLNGFVVTTGVS